MRISVIGAGRVSHHLLKVLSQQHQICQIYSRDLSKATELANQVSAIGINAYAQLDSNIDLLMIAVSDQAIAHVIEQVHIYMPNVLCVHTSGSTHIDVLGNVHARCGVFYPLQTFSFERQVDWQSTPLFVEAHQAEDLRLLQELAESLSQRVYRYSSAQRLSLHLAAVFACNFSNYCYDMAKQVVDAEQVDFSLLYPLMLETAKKATESDPRVGQTGPAMRGDQNILNMHQSMLDDNQQNQLAQVYTLLSQQILNRHQK